MTFVLVLYVLGVRASFNNWWKHLVLEDVVGKSLVVGFELGAYILGGLLVKEGPMILSVMAFLLSFPLYFEVQARWVRR